MNKAIISWPSLSRSNRAGKSQVQASIRTTHNRKTVDEDARLSMMMVTRVKKKFNLLLGKDTNTFMDQANWGWS